MSDYLVPVGLANVLVAGRCHSAESAAMASSRVTVTCMVMGQAAGIAAVLAARRKVEVRDVPIAALQDCLLANGAVILDKADRLRNEGDVISDENRVAIPNLDLKKN